MRRSRPLCAAAAARNVAPILDVLRDALPARGRALEVASGTGQHIAAFARNHPDISWWPSDPSPAARASIAAWVQEAALPNLHPPLDLDVAQPGWQMRLDAPLEAVLAVNLLHVAPWAATEGLMRGAGALLAHGGLLYVYGAFSRGGEQVSESNVAFDASLRAQHGGWGVRDMEDVEREALAHGLTPASVVAMPANNFSLLFRKQDAC